MPKQVLSDAATRARTLARQVGEEILKEPGRMAQEAARSIGIVPQDTFEQGFPRAVDTASPKVAPKDTNSDLVATRAKIRSFAQKRASEWQKTEIQAGQMQQKRVAQIVQARLEHSQTTDQAVSGSNQPSQKEEKSGGFLRELKEIFKGKRS